MKAVSIMTTGAVGATDAAGSLRTAANARIASGGVKTQSFDSALDSAKNAQPSQATATRPETPRADETTAAKPKTQPEENQSDAKAIDDGAAKPEDAARDPEPTAKDTKSEANAEEELPVKKAVKNSATAIDAMLLSMSTAASDMANALQNAANIAGDAAEKIAESANQIASELKDGTPKVPVIVSALESLIPQDAGKEMQAAHNQQLMDMLNGATFKATQAISEFTAKAQEILATQDVNPDKMPEIPGMKLEGMAAMEPPPDAGRMTPMPGEGQPRIELPGQQQIMQPQQIREFQPEAPQTADVPKEAPPLPNMDTPQMTARPGEVPPPPPPEIQPREMTRPDANMSARPENANIQTETMISNSARPAVAPRADAPKAQETQNIFTAANLQIEDVTPMPQEPAGRNMNEMFMGQNSSGTETAGEEQQTEIIQPEFTVQTETTEESKPETTEIKPEIQTANREETTTDHIAGAAQQAARTDTANAVGGAQEVQQPMQAQQTEDSYGVMRQIVDQARMIRSENGAEMVIKLNPEHLGELTLHISVNNDGEVSATFRSANAHVRGVIESSMVQLKQELQQQGIKVNNVDVQSGLSEDFFTNSQAGQQGYPQPQSSARNAAADGRAAYEDEADTLTVNAAETAETSAAPAPGMGVSEGVDYLV